MPDMHSSIYSIMQDNLKSELKYYPVLGFSDAGFFSKKTLELCHKPHKTLIIQNFALQSGYAAASIFRTLLRKAVSDRRIFLCGSLVKAFCYAKRSIVKILLRKTAYSELCFAKWLRHRIYLCGSLASAVFAVFDRPVFFGVHTCAVNSFKALADGTSYSCHQ